MNPRIILCRYRGAIWEALVAKGYVTLEVNGQWAKMQLPLTTDTYPYTEAA